MRCNLNIFSFFFYIISSVYIIIPLHPYHAFHIYSCYFTVIRNSDIYVYKMCQFFRALLHIIFIWECIFHLFPFIWQCAQTYTVHHTCFRFHFLFFFFILFSPCDFFSHFVSFFLLLLLSSSGLVWKFEFNVVKMGPCATRRLGFSYVIYIFALPCYIYLYANAIIQQYIGVAAHKLCAMWKMARNDFGFNVKSFCAARFVYTRAYKFFHIPKSVRVGRGCYCSLCSLQHAKYTQHNRQRCRIDIFHPEKNNIYPSYIYILVVLHT